MTTLLARLLAGASLDEIGTVCYFTLGDMGPGFSAAIPGIGDRTAAAAIALAAGVEPAAVEAAVRELGDYGDVAASLAVEPPREPAEPLTVMDVHRGFTEIADASGPGSVDQKIGLFASMLGAATPSERRYLVRLATGQMRLGAGDMTLLDALAEAFLGSKAERPPLEHAYNILQTSASWRTLLEEGRRCSCDTGHRTAMQPAHPGIPDIGIPERIGSSIIAVEEKAMASGSGSPRTATMSRSSHDG